VAVFTLNRPERRNGWNPQLEASYFDLLDRADRDPGVRAAILTGAGTSFCPGVDAQRLSAIAGQPMDMTGRRSPVRPWAFRKPLIAAINGGCAGMGLMQALLCDLRFAARGAKFSTAFARRGLAGEFGMTWLLPRLVGLEAATDLLLSARTFDADEALALGLVSRVVEPDELLPAARAYARDLTRYCSPTSMAMIRAQLHVDTQTDFVTAMQRAYRAMGFAAAAPDFREGIDSFVEKRQAHFAALSDDLDPAAVIGARPAEVDLDPAAATNWAGQASEETATFEEGTPR
jgi:enoyl-CoA hydratase/carnithine racemase